MRLTRCSSSETDILPWTQKRRLPRKQHLYEKIKEHLAIDEQRNNNAHCSKVKCLDLFYSFCTFTKTAFEM